jgi:hypothetical protein
MRDLEYEREKERENERRRKDREEVKRRQKERQELEKKRREKAEATIREQAKKMNWLLKEFQFHPGSFHMYKPGTKDKFKIDVFEDGVVRVDMRGVVISPENHPQVDAFMNNLRDILKGTWRTVSKSLGAHSHAEGVAHTHTHAHGHSH